ncbi:uncharacterized protein CC84DRAFT_1249335 [Paraphaeosphaeria sporulosa]|uniref:Uncharacterized protein n=1 Tax=Paraphaeosphaeria sporulosa TaxID=1460663 RepID=A0A177CAV9_9PLEO|nr:uncharacterized protein CC84DRAFT_1249335 [Paraphaeosphaeria sporulosa]OAG03918.1 hypothetical protein CC84DRAFT_1249335 [Paraphaeosphaeria sporulosa]
MSLKRKFSVSCLQELPNKVQKSLEDTQARYGALEEGSMLQTDEYASKNKLIHDPDQPDTLKEALETATMEQNLQPEEEVPMNPKRLDPKVAEMAERWEELVFIVFAKENFRQNLSAPEGHSTTSGPLTNTELRIAYCNKFNKEVGAEAALKRYRNGKQKVYNAYPKHPRNIMYAPKQNKSKRPRPGKVIKSFTGNKGVVNSPVTDIGIEPAGVEQYTERDKTNTNEVKATQNAGSNLISREERDKIEVGELRQYVESSWAVPEHEHQPWVRILLANSCERFVGACSIGAEELKSSLAYVEHRQHTNVQELWLTGVAHITLQRYIQCLSPLRLSKLPQWDLTLTPQGSDPSAAVASCKRIIWDFEATLDIYELATQLRDCHVRNLVMDHWREQMQVNSTYEVGLTEMQLLYDRLSMDEPALQFWTQALQELLPTEDTNMDIDFVDNPSSTSFVVSNRRKAESDELFHYKYHRCRLSDHNNEASYSFDHFYQIARRLLLSEGWQETDPQLHIVEKKLELELFDMCSYL